jgi:hypothetical protein
MEHINICEFQLLPFLHSIRDNVVKDKERIWLYQEPRGLMFGKERQVQLECNNGIRDRGAVWQLRLRKDTTTGNGIRGQSRRQELHLGSKKTLYETLGQTLELEVVKQTVGISNRI